MASPTSNQRKRAYWPSRMTLEGNTRPHCGLSRPRQGTRQPPVARVPVRLDHIDQQNPPAPRVVDDLDQARLVAV
ncbi:MAG: hypothetical protein WB562_08165, partial [Candidatus Sulfotelmatobacter sp.]